MQYRHCWGVSPSVRYAYIVLGIDRLMPGDFAFIRNKDGSGDPMEDHFLMANVDITYVQLAVDARTY